jgi:biotin operon repressor
MDHAVVSVPRADRRDWRDGIKRSTLPTNARFVALLMADYWPKDDGTNLWCSVETIMSQAGMSRSTVYRSLAALQDAGWLVQTEAARGNRSPRYAPILPVEGSQSDTPAVSSRHPSGSQHDTRHETNSRQNSGMGSSDPWAAAPRPTNAPSTERKPGPVLPRDQRTRDRMQADYTRLRALCLEVGEERPLHVYWTLYNEHNAKHPDSFMRELVESGQWDGFVGRYGISEYNSDGSAA